MIRRAPLAVLAAAVTLTGCGTFTDNDVVAEVEGATLVDDELTALVADQWIDGEAPAEIDGDTARVIVGNFVGAEVLRADLEAIGSEVSAPETDGMGPAETLQTELQAVLDQWFALPADQIVDDLVVARYAEGPEESGVTCAAHILVETEEDAAEVVAALDEGADFAELAASRSTDTGSAANGGSLGCSPTDQFRTTFVPEFVDAALAADIGEPTDPVESQFGYHIIRLQPLDELPPDVALTIRIQTFEDRYDISIDPRIGEWDPFQLIVPVG